MSTTKPTARVVAALATGVLGIAAHAADVDAEGPPARNGTGNHVISGQLDLRIVASDATPSFVHDGMGLTRFDDEHEGAQLGRIFLEYRGRLLQTLSAHVVLDTYGDSDKNPLDVSEMNLEWRPYPRNSWRWRIKAGAFYAPISLENRGAGWNSVYSLTPSAINTWLGEEIRTVGVETNATWLGTRSGAPFDVSLIAGLYGWNDPAGVLIFQRGWALHDRQTALFGGIPQPFYPNGTTRQQLELFHEIDNKAGYYAGVQLTHRQGITFRALHYDNRGDPAVGNGYEVTWLTRFDSAGLKIEFPNEWTFATQWMSGDTSVGPSVDGRGRLISDYTSYYALLSRSFNKHRLTARYDDFETESTRGAQIFDSWQDGDARLLAYTYTHDDHWQFIGEATRIDSRVRQRALLGLPRRALEQTLQVALRYSF